MKKRTSLWDNALIWFGAGVSLAEILTGTYFAPLGFARGLAAILAGHLIGCILLFLAGVIGGKTGKSSMETVKDSFGGMGGGFFALLNVLQLLGWTAVMIFDGAQAAAGIFRSPPWVWSLIIGGLILLWILIGIRNPGKINTLAMAALLILTLILCKVIFFDGSLQAASGEGLSFGAAVELAAAMPLSWLPLISDYMREAENPVGAAAVSAGVYGIVSTWMYLIGMGAALFTGESDMAAILLKAGLGIAGLAIAVFSTVTTTFLDAWSAGISAESLLARLPGRYAAVAVTVLGTLGALFLPLENITGFLYLIGSVFAPMIAIQITDFYILRRTCRGKKCDLPNMLLWLAGFLLYRLLMRADLFLGSTLPDMLLTSLLCMGYAGMEKAIKKA